MIDPQDKKDSINIAITCSAYNVNNLTEIINKIDVRGFIYINHLIINIVERPHFLQPNVLPENIRIQSYEKIIKSNWYKLFPEKFILILEKLKKPATEKQHKLFVLHNKKFEI